VRRLAQRRHSNTPRAAAPEGVLRAVTDRDGPLAHLLEERRLARLALEQVEARLDTFLAAAQYLSDRASGRPAPPPSALIQPVRECIDQITQWSADRAPRPWRPDRSP
jgi:hypothetical protein